MLTFYSYSYTSSKTYFGNIFYLIIIIIFFYDYEKKKIILYYELSYLT